jgi:hypothetical protein
MPDTSDGVCIDIAQLSFLVIHLPDAGLTPICAIVFYPNLTVASLAGNRQAIPAVPRLSILPIQAPGNIRVTATLGVAHLIIPFYIYSAIGSGHV